MKVLPAVLLCLATLGSAQAQNPSVWRCGTDGRSYSDSPCPGGREVQVADARSAQQRQEAMEVVARDRALAQQLAQERREREREWSAHGPGLIAVGPVAAAKPAAVKPPKRQTAKPKGQEGAPSLAARGTSPSAARGSRRKTG